MEIVKVLGAIFGEKGYFLLGFIPEFSCFYKL